MNSPGFSFTTGANPLAKPHRGFSLVEMAVVLVIIGLLLGGLLMPLSTQMENDRRKETTATLESIREALIGFAIVNGRLPCRDRNIPPDGRENCTGGGAGNFLPFADLGVSGVDAWGNAWTYSATNAFTQVGTYTRTTPGDIDIGTLANNCTPTTTLLAENVPVLVKSNAATSHAGGLEAENNDGDTCFIDAGYRQVTNGFDDLIIWIPTGVLINRLVAAEIL